MSSHREAPEISQDPVADNTDVYAFVSPDKPDTVTLIANYIPLQGPAGGPNFYEFGDDVRYAIHIDNTGDGKPDVTYELTFTTKIRNRNTFLYNTGPITSLGSTAWNRPQTYTLRRITRHGTTVLGRNLSCPPCNIGPLSTPDYGALARAAVHRVPRHTKVFAGQRAEGFYVDLGAIFDLLDPRPFANLHTTFGLMNLPGRQGEGVNTTAHVNVHTIALQVPTGDLTRDGKARHAVSDRKAVIGVWAAAYRRKVRILGRGPHHDDDVHSGPWVQVSRLGNPLVNEVIIPMARKDEWNALPPHVDSRFARYVAHPEVANLLPGLFPGVFPNLAALNASRAPRADLLAILLTGLPSGIVPGFQNFTGPVQADVLRLNTAVPPARTPNVLGILGGDLAGYPNGRRVADDVVAIELRAVAGLTYPLVAPSYTPDGAAGLVDDGVTPDDLVVPFLGHFPYLGVPHSGFFVPAA